MASTVLGTSMTFPLAQLAVSSSPFSQMMMGLPSLATICWRAFIHLAYTGSLIMISKMGTVLSYLYDFS